MGQLSRHWWVRIRDKGPLGRICKSDTALLVKGVRGLRALSVTRICQIYRKKALYNDAIGLVVMGILCYEPQTLFLETALSCCQIIDIWAKMVEIRAMATQALN